MGASNLLPLVVLFAVVGVVAWVGYQVSILVHIMYKVLLTHMLPDLPLYERTRRARRPQAGEEECRLYERWRKGWREGN
jgi:hypothetical protein